MNDYCPELGEYVRNLIGEGKFDIRLQPIVAPRERLVLGFEVLSHFDPSTLSEEELSTAQLTAVIEDLRLTPQFDLQVVDKTLAALQWLRTGYGMEPIASVNLCAATLTSADAQSGKDFLAEITQRLKRADISVGKLQLEISESAMLSDEARDRVIPALAAIGFPIAIDEFISGHSHFAALGHPDITTIKIDETISLNIPGTEIPSRFIRGLLLLVEALNKQLVIVGVQSKEQFQLLEVLGCSRYQGRYFSSAMPIEDVPGFIERFTALPETLEPGRDKDLDKLL